MAVTSRLGYLVRRGLLAWRLIRSTYIPVIAAGTPTVSARLVGFEQLETLSSPSQSLREMVKSVFGSMAEGLKECGCDGKAQVRVSGLRGEEEEWGEESTDPQTPSQTVFQNEQDWPK